MKTLLFLMTLVLLGFTSCHTANFNNFNKKKFTNLKPTSTTYPDQDAPVQTHSSAFSDSKSPQKVNFKDDLDRLTENDPKILEIKKAIKNGTKIFIKNDTTYYQVNDPFYDGFSENLIGRLEKSEKPENEDFLEVKVSNLKENKVGFTEISANDIISAETVIGFDNLKVGAEEAHVTEPEESRQFDQNEKANWKETYKSRVRKVKIHNLDSNPEAAVHDSDSFKKGRKQFLLTMLVFLPLAAIFLLLGIFANFAFIFLGAALLIITYSVGCVSAFNFRLYIDECKLAGVKPKPGVQLMRVILWFGIFVMSFLTYFALAGLILILIAKFSKKRFRLKMENQ